jgi:hypothetical protein
MVEDMELEKKINDILTKWNPIGVPDVIASDEYTDCIIECGRCSATIKRPTVIGVKRAWNRREGEQK